MVPSVDRVGRYFHLALVAELPHSASLLAATTNLETFFDRAQQLVIETLGAEEVDFERFDQEVASLSSELEAVCDPQVPLDSAPDVIASDAQSEGWQIPIGWPGQMRSMFDQLLSQRLSRLYEPLVLWWTDGSAAIEPTCLIGKGLPQPEAFAALLDGSWQRGRWQPVPRRSLPGDDRAERMPLVDDPTPPQYRSAAATDVGCVRKVNQDSLIERTDVGVWAVADGLGGHSNGEVASRMVCDALSDVAPEGSFEETIAMVEGGLHGVNDYLVRVSRGRNDRVSGSTVVALLTRGTRCAVLWVGDSRVYRARGGTMEQLTTDHSLSTSELTVPSNVVTRAIGGEATLAVDVYRERVRAGDRFLLCSDGLTKILPLSEIESWMQQPDIRASVEGLVAETLRRGAPDNVTVLIVEAYS
jgi:type VI secretion system protein ImpM